jgi:hypothetical protein
MLMEILPQHSVMPYERKNSHPNTAIARTTTAEARHQKGQQGSGDVKRPIRTRKAPAKDTTSGDVAAWQDG